MSARCQFAVADAFSKRFLAKTGTQASSDIIHLIVGHRFTPDEVWAISEGYLTFEEWYYSQEDGQPIETPDNYPGVEDDHSAEDGFSSDSDYYY